MPPNNWTKVQVRGRRRMPLNVPRSTWAATRVLAQHLREGAARRGERPTKTLWSHRVLLGFQHLSMLRGYFSRGAAGHFFSRGRAFRQVFARNKTVDTYITDTHGHHQ